jgi:SAM-dependent methyltransferase
METDNTARSFRDKWHRNASLVFKETLREDSSILRWILERNGWDSLDALRVTLTDRRRVLDAGCGNGRVTALLRQCTDPLQTQVVGIDLVSHEVAQSNLADTPNMQFFQADLVDDLDRLGRFDYIYCQEVLHHTSDPARSFGNLVSLLEPSGEIGIYVYKIKAPVREFTDDYVRGSIAALPYEEAMRLSAQITQLGKALSDLNVKVRVPDVEVLGIEAGEYDVQRLIYNTFAKCFWNPELTTEANGLVNYDWYHPQTATRHTLPEVLGWFAAEGLTVKHQHVDPYGITVRGVRPIA